MDSLPTAAGLAKGTVPPRTPSLADQLTIEPRASIFFSYARETELSARFGAEGAGVNSTLLVPTNRAVMALARKPFVSHEGPAPIKEGVILPEQEYDALSKANVERWVSAHIIPQSPISLLSPSIHETLLTGKSVTFTQSEEDDSQPEWSRVLMDGDVRIIGSKEASNGVMYIIDGTVKID
ncbi:hypothetical protein WOLCODRAFT_62726 [Wolfiporia cocos MD-104 SS10]|uniref:FAS1 domain-containing protein n=1 Tax=Wolfiporia cocos (strain MD-104) TaxID=742152 RepID=A0A2H3IWE5_WOLCO|nr:hypothetical protein WOLCODRAFT_62726 [Wolfiporia cocos MD-104 SS10]